MPNTLTHARVHNRPTREEGAGAREHRLVDARHIAHTSVMVTEVLDALSISEKDTVLDATLGLGGHSEALLDAGVAHLVGLDADHEALEKARERLARFGSRVELLEANFADAGEVLSKLGIFTLDKALFDFGWNMTQLSAGRGFSFLADDELSMSYGKNPRSGLTGAQMLNTLSEEALANIFYGYGEERYSRRIAKAVVAARKTDPIQTSAQFAKIIQSAVPAAYRNGRLHPATKSFQALRIAVNDELGAIEKGLTAVWKMLAPGGRIATITFHSIEDRLLKRMFAQFAKEGGKLLFKKPLAATREEITHNPAARSAKVRAIEKI